MKKKVRCLCCGYRTLDERGGFDICPVCFWEDDCYFLFDKKDENGNIMSVFCYNNSDDDDFVEGVRLVSDRIEEIFSKGKVYLLLFYHNVRNEWF